MAAIFVFAVRSLTSWSFDMRSTRYVNPDAIGAESTADSDRSNIGTCVFGMSRA